MIKVIFIVYKFLPDGKIQRFMQKFQIETNCKMFYIKWLQQEL